MATVHLDRITTLSMVERPLTGGGTMSTELIREARVTGLTDTDYYVLQQALDSIGLIIGTSAGGHESLILVERRPRLLSGHPDVVDVILRYEQRGLTLDSVPEGVFVMEGGAGLNQITTQRDRAGDPLTVNYTYPADYALDEGLRGKTVDQVGDVQVGMPAATLRLAGRLIAQQGDDETAPRVGKINNEPFRGRPEGTWLCSNGEFSPYYYGAAGGQSVFEFRFSLEHNEFGWDPDKWYRDPRSGRMPVGAAITEVVWYDPAPFDVLFPIFS